MILGRRWTAAIVACLAAGTCNLPAGCPDTLQRDLFGESAPREFRHSVKVFTHGVTEEWRCDEVARRYQRNGWKVTRHWTTTSPSGGVLRYICNIETDGAAEGIYDDNRYERRDY